MTFNSAMALIALPALTFGVLYFPVLHRVSPGLQSPYERADPARRLVAAAIDASLVAVAMFFALYSDSAWLLAPGAAYAGLRDGFGGRSVGKFCAGLVVLRLETGRPCSVADSLKRNLVFLFPGVGVVAAILETVTMIRDPSSYRLGDRVARTQVVEGFGAKDLAASFGRWWLRPPSRVRGRRPQPVQRQHGAIP